MRRALALARRGQGRVEPNPLVGAVLVRGGRVLAEGWHRAYGGSHAEVEAIRRLAAAGRPGGTGVPPLRGAILYVTLEPCAHFGKTPPCAPYVIASGVRRVVVATRDPNPVNAGRGVALLRGAGVEVVEGVLAAEARELNAPFFKLHRTGLPWVVAKWAMSADGKIATRAGESKWITGPAARAYARRLRARCQAVVVGIGTALRDDPGLLAFDTEPLLPPASGLTARGRDPERRRQMRSLPPERRAPRPYVRVILDSRARLPLRSRLVRTARRAGVLVAVSARAPARRCRALERAGCEVLVAGRARPDLGRLLAEFGRRAFTHALVEGGGETLGSAFDGGFVDEVYAFVAPRVIGGAAATAAVGGLGPRRIDASQPLRGLECIRIGPDCLLHGHLH